MSKCTILAHVRRPDGSIVESKLFKDLLHYTASRSEAKEHYAVATNQDFLDKIRDRVEFDENGEVTFNSYKNIVGITENDKLLDTLNKDVQAGLYTYQEAIGRLQNFNRNNPFNKGYMATIVPSGNQYKLSVVKRTPAQESKLEDIIHKQSLQDRIVFYLNRAGVAVDFINQDGLEGGRYSTINAQQSADGLYHLIRIAHGENVTDALAEEAGHFAVGALGNTPLVERLLRLLNEDVQKQILGDDYNNKALGNNPRREVAGVLVGRALQNKVNNKMAWQKLANRVAFMAKKIFYTLKGDEVKSAMLQAEKTARQIAEGFVSPNFEGKVETALETKETLYDAKPSYNIKTYREVNQRLRKLAQELDNIASDGFSQQVNQIMAQVETGRGLITNRPGFLGDLVALEGIAEAVSSIVDMCGPDQEIDRLLKSIDFDNIGNFMDSLSENGRKLRQVRTFLQNSMVLASIINNSLDTTSGKAKLSGPLDNIILNNGNQNYSVNLRQVLDTLNQMNGIIERELKTKEFQFFSRFLQDSYGEKYITHSARMLFKRQGGKIVFKPVAETTQSISEVIDSSLESMEKDISLFERYMASMSNNPDIVGQIVDKVAKQANKTADDLTNAIFDELRILRKRLADLGHNNTSFLFEKGRDGKLTGNILSEKNWGDWETDRAKFFKAEKEAFLQANPNLNTMSETERALQWDMWFRPKYKQWNKDHSEWDDLEERWIPNDDYYNPEFETMVPENSELRKWYYDFMNLKKDLDARLPEGSTLPVRMPQFKGTFINKVQNRRLFENTAKSFRHTLRSSFLDKFCESSEDQDYGSLQTYNSEEEELFHSAVAFEQEKMNRIPIFGINKLKDMGDLSTDLFHTTLAYASMANSYLAMDSIVDTLEVGATVLQNRKIGGVSTEEETKGNKSNAYNRYLKYLEKQVYGISMKRHKIGNVVWEKVVNASNRLAAFMFLGGNVAGGLVNTGTGFLEILKEAATGEYYNIGDWNKANQAYFGSFVRNFGRNLIDYGKKDADNRIALFIRHFNMQGENRQNYREFETRHSWLYNAAGKSIFLPYKSGDHYMQSMSYLALGNHIKLWDENGNKVSLLDAYSIIDNKDEDGIVAGKTLSMKGTFYKTANGKDTYDMIQSILSKINSSSLLSPINLTQEEQDYLNNQGYNLADTENTVRQLEEDAKRLIWTEDDESDFMNKAREVNNRLHGIYNNQDKVAFSQNWFGNAFLSMKGWALGMAERRFASNHYSIALGKDVEGSLVTLAKVWRNCGASKEDFFTAIRATMLPFGNKAAANFQRLGWSVNQWKNMKRNFFDTLAIGLLLLIKGLSALPPEEDDDEYWKALYGENWKEYKAASEQDVDVARGLIYYFSNRLFREQSALNNPFGWYYESTTLLDITPAGFAAVADLSKLTYQLVGSAFADEDNSDFFYQSEKKDKYEKGDPKWQAHLKRITPYVKSEYVFTQPYEASESFEYGRNVKNR